MGALSANRQATAVPEPAIATKVHQTLDVDGHLTFEEAKRAVADPTLTVTERAIVGDILRDFFIQRANGATSPTPAGHAATTSARALAWAPSA